MPGSGSALIAFVTIDGETLPITGPSYAVPGAGPSRVPVLPPRLEPTSLGDCAECAPLLVPEPGSYWCLGAFFDVAYPEFTGPGEVPVVPCYQ